jgi:hypothetical protein
MPKKTKTIVWDEDGTLSLFFFFLPFVRKLLLSYYRTDATEQQQSISVLLAEK